ncbi:MAG: class I SAM-dependent methyltransferase [Chloroflexota bacterium]
MAPPADIFSDVARWYAASTIALGLETGLTQALLAGGGTADELAAAAGVDGDNAARWADAMVTAGYATLVDGRFAPDEEAVGILRGGAPLDVEAVVHLLVGLGGLLPRAAQAIRDGRGIRSEEFQALGIAPERVNVPMYEQLLLTEWIAGHPDLEAALRAGIDVAEVGPGGGTALRLLGAAFSASRFTGFDLDARVVAQANASAEAAGLENVRFTTADGAGLPAGSFDLVCMFDVFHHMTTPGPVLDGLRGSLRTGGSLLLAESSGTGDPVEDGKGPMGILMYGSDLIYCYQESKTAGVPGLGATWPPRGLAAMLREHRFDEVARVSSQAGYEVIRARPS